MRKTLFSVIVAFITLTSQVAHGTTWAPSTVKDPISGSSVKVSEPLSSGSYIYEWPEKSDQVFWPYTDNNWLWFSEKTGYIAFGNDFAELDEAGRATLKQWLRENYNPKAPPESRLDRLLWAERVYTARGMDDDFWLHFLRLMAFETREDAARSNAYAARALPLLVARLEKATETGPKLEALYLLSEYHRRLGNAAESEKYLALLQSTDAGEQFSNYKEYVLKIAAEQRAKP